jgi:hypothetical protein
MFDQSSTKRIEVLNNLLSFNEDLLSIHRELQKFDWDSEVPLVVLTRRNLIAILERYTSMLINDQTLEDWANTIELRDDIDFESEEIKEAVHSLSNPYLYGGIKAICDRLTPKILIHYLWHSEP